MEFEKFTKTCGIREILKIGIDSSTSAITECCIQYAAMYPIKKICFDVCMISLSIKN